MQNKIQNGIRRFKSSEMVMTFDIIEPGEIFTEQDFVYSEHSPKVIKDYISQVRDFLVEKRDEGLVINIPQPNGTIKWEKVPKDITMFEYYKKVFNTIPNGTTGISSRSFMERYIPKKFQKIGNISSFISSMKHHGCVKEVLDSRGLRVLANKCYTVTKISDAENITSYIRGENPAKKRTVRKKKKLSQATSVASPSTQFSKVVDDMGNNEVKQLMSDMTPADTGMSIFHAAFQLSAENEKLKSENKTLQQDNVALQQANDRLQNHIEKMGNRLKKSQNKKQMTFKSFEEMAEHARAKQ